eukprot:scpid80667/ scgid16602/ 
MYTEPDMAGSIFLMLRTLPGRRCAERLRYGRRLALASWLTSQLSDYTTWPAVKSTPGEAPLDVPLILYDRPVLEKPGQPQCSACSGQLLPSRDLRQWPGQHMTRHDAPRSRGQLNGTGC